MNIELEPLKKIIDRYGLNPKKNLGQNFILDQNITDKIVRSADVREGDLILEIGPGPGGLTRSILASNPKKLLVVEQDKRCIEALKELQVIYPNLEIINDDALKIIEQDIIPKNAKIIANLPYNIGTVLLFKWLENIDYFSSLTLMFQKEVAERIIAKPKTKDYGRISVMAQLLCEVDHHFDLKPDVFFPPPKVTSSLISLYPKKNKPSSDIIAKVEKIVKITFNQRRKMLRATLKQLVDDPEIIISNTGVKLTQRPEELVISDFVQLAINLT